MSSCCPRKCCHAQFEMICGEVLDFGFYMEDLLDSLGGTAVEDVNWAFSKPLDENADLELESHNYDPRSFELMVRVGGGEAGINYQVTAFITLCGGQRIERCFELYVKDC